MYEPTRDDLRSLREWIDKLEYLPHDLEDHILTLYYRCSKGSLERTKVLIDRYYGGRLRFPEVMTDLDPLSTIEKSFAKCCHTTYLPQKTKDGVVVVVLKFLPGATENFDTDGWIRSYFITACTLFYANELGSGRVAYITDCKNFTMEYITKMTPSSIYKAVSLASSVIPIRIAGLHGVNLPPACEWMITLAKKILPPKISKRLHVHSKPEGLLQFFPKEILPSDFGGTEESVEILNNKYRKKAETYSSRFIEDEMKFRKLDALRPSNTSNNIVGSFRNLGVD